MKRFVALAGLVLLAACQWAPNAVNPDPNHAHADFAVVVNGKALDFSGAQYMSGSSTDPLHTGAKHPYYHLHDGNGHVIHRHKPGLPIFELFRSIGLTMTGDCLTLDDAQFAALDPGWVQSFAITKKLCDNGKFRWTMIVNGTPRAMDPMYVFNDGDAILFTYDTSDDHADLWKKMTHDACLYSKTCPWRGDPPTENCIADPTVPCTI